MELFAFLRQVEVFTDFDDAAIGRLAAVSRLARFAPGDAIVRFKEPTFLEAHRNEAIMAAAVFLLQAGLIAWLLVERRHRRLANLAVQQQRFELAHAARLAVAGELTGAIAHEINQPLGAILSNADTADLLLASGADRRVAASYGLAQAVLPALGFVLAFLAPDRRGRR